MIWDVVNDGRLPFPTVSDAKVPSLQLSTEGAPDSLIKSNAVEVEGFLTTIRGRLHVAFDSSQRFLSFAEFLPLNFPLYRKYFTDANGRHIAAQWNTEDANRMKYAPLVPFLEHIDLLLKYGGDPNVLNKQQTSPLHLGDKGYAEDTALIQRLVDPGGDVNAANVDGEILLFRVWRSSSLL
ncbi:hypothetical protein ARMGADRAFT_1115868 [Armillaria gallica]|uniref:Uncharacterized protein n=1 Tax=Armillaria gallica TaxID=47427 RepID=A0A2H3D454_ARMGA|nr:hypothetical protein ARMGADRAFT_1115868 [Armillaria gallica]